VTVSNAVASVTSSTAVLSVGGSGQDTDGDGLPDEWELAFGLNPLDGADRTSDPDGDRSSNWDEYVAGNQSDQRPKLSETEVGESWSCGSFDFCCRA
jgi:hypothetical protein